MTAFKICGVTRRQDAEAAVEAGAAAVGVIFAASPRQVDIHAARRAIGDLTGVARVGVFAGQSVSLIVEAVDACGLDWVQLSGGEPASVAREVAARCGVRVLRAVHLERQDDLAGLAGYPADAWLVDAPVREGRRGGTGRTFDWSLLEAAARRGGGAGLAAGPEPGGMTRDRMVVAGGLSARNVGDAIRRLRPAGVDVCSGVEASPGIKDMERIRAFAAAVREATGESDPGNGRGVFA